MRKMKVAGKPTEIKECFTEICDYLDTVDTKIGTFMKNHTNACYEKVKDFVYVKEIEYGKSRSMLQTAMAESPSYARKREVMKLKEEIKRLKQELEVSKEQNDLLKSENRKLKAQIENFEDDNSLLRKKISKLLNEIATIKLASKNICEDLERVMRISLEREELSSILVKFRKLSGEKPSLKSFFETKYEKSSLTERKANMRRTQTMGFVWKNPVPPSLILYKTGVLQKRAQSRQRSASRNRTVRTTANGDNLA